MKKIFSIILITIMVNTFVFSQYNFKVEKKIKTTSVKNQQRTGTCWSFASSSFLESELMRLGKGEHNLSEMFVVHNIYLAKAWNYFYRQGKTNFSEGGLAHDILLAIRKYGIVPEEVYDGRNGTNKPHDHSEMSKLLKAILDATIKQKRPSGNWINAYSAILDTYMGEAPEEFEYKGKKYTPQSFAKSLGFDADDYVEITSFSHQPFYKTFVLEIPDNFSNGIYYNVPIEDLMEITNYALNNDFSVAWDGDVSEKGFAAGKGVAIVPKQESKAEMFEEPQEELEVSQATRQETFNNYSTTDDHLMHVVGIAKDQNGTKYYLIKNSWGEISKYKGFLYASEAYYKLKTVSIMVHKDAIPKSIAKKMF